MVLVFVFRLSRVTFLYKYWGNVMEWRMWIHGVVCVLQKYSKCKRQLNKNHFDAVLYKNKSECYILAIQEQFAKLARFFLLICRSQVQSTRIDYF